MKHGSERGRPRVQECSTSTPIKRYHISSETLYSEILMLITNDVCEVNDSAWRFQLKLQEEYKTIATLKEVKNVVQEVLVNMQIEQVSNGIRS